MMLARVHHLGLTVTDAQASARWYEDVLGFRRDGEHTSDDGSRHKVFLAHDRLGVRIGLCQHGSAFDPRFDETRPGLDHLSFAVDTVEDLHTWRERLLDAGAACSAVTAANTIPGASVVVFRDPDNIQLELIAIS
jgi:glyoxylase I family protein